MKTWYESSILRCQINAKRYEQEGDLELRDYYLQEAENYKVYLEENYK
jgi:hypothetical protein